jgi:dTDP-4-dehydrorhamnose reductase
MSEGGGAILVFGRSGQLAQELADLGARGGRRIVRLGRDACDLLAGADPAAPIDALRPAAVINAAAYTAVDRAEAEPDLALRLNRDAPAAVAAACAARGLPFLHVSTDYVFDGSKGAPYVEHDSRRPLGAYGRSKAEGEDAVRAAGGVSAVVRTGWLWSVHGSNFPKTMLRLAQGRDEVGVVADQRGRPTHAAVLAQALVALADRLATGEAAARGVFHLANRGDAVWADVAEAVFSASRARGGPGARVKRITTADYPTPARRPADSRLDASKLEALLGAPFPDWRESLEGAMDALLAAQAPVPAAG